MNLSEFKTIKYQYAEVHNSSPILSYLNQDVSKKYIEGLSSCTCIDHLKVYITNYMKFAFLGNSISCKIQVKNEFQINSNVYEMCYAIGFKQTMTSMESHIN